MWDLSDFHGVDASYPGVEAARLGGLLDFLGAQWPWTVATAASHNAQVGHGHPAQSGNMARPRTRHQPGIPAPHLVSRPWAEAILTMLRQREARPGARKVQRLRSA